MADEPMFASAFRFSDWIFGCSGSRNRRLTLPTNENQLTFILLFFIVFLATFIFYSKDVKNQISDI